MALLDVPSLMAMLRMRRKPPSTSATHIVRETVILAAELVVLRRTRGPIMTCTTPSTR
jgi:ABC-type taurine transport system ATPase subunit